VIQERTEACEQGQVHEQNPGAERELETEEGNPT
jgi:hypothetical protein